MGNVKIILLVIALLGAAGASAWGVWEYRGQKIKALEAVNAQLEFVAKSNEEAIAEYQADVERMQTALNRYAAEVAANEQTVERLERKLERHDLELLTRRKPKLIERRVNAGVADAWRCDELASGHEHTQAELLAEKPSEINTACPELANPNFDATNFPEWQERNQ